MKKYFLSAIVNWVGRVWDINYFLKLQLKIIKHALQRKIIGRLMIDKIVTILLVGLVN